MEANKQASKDVEVRDLLHESEELSSKAIHEKLSELYLQRLSGKKYKKAIMVQDNNQKMFFIIDYGKEMGMPYHSLWIKTECYEPLSGLAVFLSAFKLNLVDDEMVAHNPFISKSEAVELMKKDTLCVADRNGHVYYNQENGFCVDCRIIQELPDGEYIPETALLRFRDIE